MTQVLLHKREQQSHEAHAVIHKLAPSFSGHVSDVINPID